MPDKKTIYMTVHADLALSAKELWPDGGPEDPTEDDVHALIQEYGAEEVLSWFMIDHGDFDVHVSSPPPLRPPSSLGAAMDRGRE